MEINQGWPCAGVRGGLGMPGVALCKALMRGGGGGGGGGYNNNKSTSNNKSTRAGQ